MHPLRKKRLIVIVFIGLVLCLSCTLILFALKQNISLFYTPSEIQQGKAPQHQLIRVGGMVVKGSVVRDKSSLAVHFILTDFSRTITVYYHKILPDLFREGQGIVAKGQLNGRGQFIASEVLAKHDENYMPPEVKASLKNKADGTIAPNQSLFGGASQREKMIGTSPESASKLWVDERLLSVSNKVAL